tara:strand:+ start:9021 stop:9221 length:201 start_codon:yes stop_codon:yes gene_type:complete
MSEDFLENVVVDICTRTFLLNSEQGDERFVECETTEEFMNVLKVCTDRLHESQIKYSDLALRKKGE